MSVINEARPIVGARLADGVARAAPALAPDADCIQQHLHMVAATLAEEAQQSDDPRLTGTLMQACGRVVAVARVHARLQTLDLGDQAEVVRVLPALWEDLRACFDDDVLAQSRLELVQFGAPAAEAIEGVMGELARSGARYGSEEGCIVSVRLEQNGHVRRLTFDGAGASVSDGAASKSGSPGMALWRRLVGQFGGRREVAPAARGPTISVRYG